MFVKSALTLGVAFAFLTAPSIAQTAPETYGHAKMSAGEIAATISEMSHRVASDASKTPSIFGPLSFVEDALYDFERRHRNDANVPRDLYALARLYNALPPEQGATFASQIAAWLRKDYPKTSYVARLQEAEAKTPRDVPASDPSFVHVVDSTPSVTYEATPAPIEAPPVTTIPSKPRNP